MCGLAGLIHRDGAADIGREMTRMLQLLRHRGPDSTGYALYGTGADAGDAEGGSGGGGAADALVMRVKFAEQADLQSGFGVHEQIRGRKAELRRRLEERGVEALAEEEATEYASRLRFRRPADLKGTIDYLEDIAGVEILSLGRALELVKDLGDAAAVDAQYGLSSFRGTHAIGHTRMATESAVDIRSAHPYWAYPFSDIAVVHNGQLTNYWSFRRALERRGHRFMSDCDSELIAVYAADRMDRGDDLEAAMHRSVAELDGVFTYVIATADSLGMAKDVMAAKPMVLYESDDFVGLASEEVAIRGVFPHEIETHDPYEGEVLAWRVNGK